MHKPTIRFVQTFVIAALALFATFVFLGNLMDYDSNYQFVKHVLAMDTTFEGNKLMWRAVTGDGWVTMVYWGIIAVEGAVALLGWIATVKMMARLRSTSAAFTQAKLLGYYAFILALLLWFVGFIVVGSEWFAMWQSETWNGKQTAMDIVEVVGIFLVVYLLPEAWLTGSAAAPHVKPIAQKNAKK